MQESKVGYSGIAQATHWLSALLILTMIPLGLVMTGIESDSGQKSLYQVHVGLGLVVLVLTVTRLVTLVFKRWPAPPTGMSSLHEKAFHAVHVLIYVVLVGSLATGMGMLIFSGITPFPSAVVPAAIEDIPPRFIHHFLGIALIPLLLIHIAGVLLHQLRRGETLSRMGVRWFG